MVTLKDWKKVKSLGIGGRVGGLLLEWESSLPGDGEEMVKTSMRVSREQVQS